jgi:hypothetical protein
MDIYWAGNAYLYRKFPIQTLRQLDLTKYTKDLGLHRKSQKRRSPLEYEMCKRVFWTCYCLDRQVSIILGRPFAIADRDIDVPVC